MSPDSPKGSLIVFAAPSGAGKTTIIHRVMNILPDLQFSISSTTRSQREGEVNGLDYDFLTDAQFDEALQQGDFIEYEWVHEKRYGTRMSRIQPLLEAGKSIVFDLDVLGALHLKQLFPSALLIYIDVLSAEVLRQRLIDRGREDMEEIKLRLKRYEMESEKAKQFDVHVINDDLERAVQEVVDIIEQFRRGK